MSYINFIAFKHLLKHRTSGFISIFSFISIAGIAVGVMALIVVMAVMSGFDRDLKAKIVGANPHIMVQAYGGVSDPAATVNLIKQSNDPYLKSVAPYVQGQGIIRSKSNATGVVIKGVDEESDDLGEYVEYMRLGKLGFNGEEESPLGGKLPGVVVGWQLANILDVGVGGKVYLISPTLNDSENLLPTQAKSLPFEVTGVFELGMSDIDSGVALIDIPRAQELFQLKGSVSGIGIKMTDVDRSEQFKVKLFEILGTGYFVRSWLDMNRNFFAALKVEKTVMSILLFLIIMVAAFNIISTLIMLVMEKTKDVGLLRSLGATRGGIRRIFLLEGMIVGVIGVFSGAVLGLLLAFNVNQVAAGVEKVFGIEVFPSDIYYFNQIPAEINFSDVSAVVVISLVMALLAGLYPAHKASKLNPVEALRYE